MRSFMIYLTHFSIFITLGCLANGQNMATPLPLPILIDGKVHPELIPDDLAYKHFIMSVAIRGDAGDTDIKRRDSITKGLTLSPADQTSLIKALNGVKEKLDDFERQRRTADPTSQTLEQTLVYVNQQQDAELLAAKNRLLLGVSVPGIELIQAFIRSNVKPNIVVYSYSLSSDGSTLFNTVTVTDHSNCYQHSGYQTTAEIFTPDGRSASTQSFGLFSSTNINFNDATGDFTFYGKGTFYCGCAHTNASFGGGFTVTLKRNNYILAMSQPCGCGSGNICTGTLILSGGGPVRPPVLLWTNTIRPALVPQIGIGIMRSHTP